LLAKNWSNVKVIYELKLELKQTSVQALSLMLSLEPFATVNFMGRFTVEETCGTSLVAALRDRSDRQTNRRTDGQTDGQHHRVNHP